MKSTEKQLELIRRCLDGQSTEEEFAQLEALIRSDADFRKDYLRYLNVDSALAVLPKESDGAATMSAAWRYRIVRQRGRFPGQTTPDGSVLLK